MCIRDRSRAEQTVLVSVGFQHGTSFTRKDGSDMNFIKQAASGDWDAVLANLKDFGDAFPTRRNKEAKLLEDEKKILGKKFKSLAFASILSFKGFCNKLITLSGSRLFLEQYSSTASICDISLD